MHVIPCFLSVCSRDSPLRTYLISNLNVVILIHEFLLHAFILMFACILLK